MSLSTQIKVLGGLPTAGSPPAASSLSADEILALLAAYFETTIEEIEDVFGGAGVSLPIAQADVSGLVDALAAKAASSDLSTEATTRGNADTALDGRLDALEAMALPASAAGPAELRLAEDTDNGAHYTGFKSPSSLATNLDYTLPSEVGSPGAALTDPAGDKNLNWSDKLRGVSNNASDEAGTAIVACGMKTRVPSTSYNLLAVNSNTTGQLIIIDSEQINGGITSMRIKQGVVGSFSGDTACYKTGAPTGDQCQMTVSGGYLVATTGDGYARKMGLCATQFGVEY